MIYWGYSEELATIDSVDQFVSPFKAPTMAQAIEGAKTMCRVEPWEPGELPLIWLWTEQGHILGFVHQGEFYRAERWEDNEEIEADIIERISKAIEDSYG